MTRTNLDFLFQLTTPVSERAAIQAPDAGDAGAAFGDHLSQASSTGFASSTSAAGDRPHSGGPAPKVYESSQPKAPATGNASDDGPTANDPHRVDHASRDEEGASGDSIHSDSSQSYAESDSEEDERDSLEQSQAADAAAVAVAVVDKKPVPEVAVRDKLITAANKEDAVLSAEPSDAAAQSDAPIGRVAAKKSSTGPTTREADAPASNPIADSVQAPVAAVELVAEPAASAATDKSRAAKAKRDADVSSQRTDNVQSAAATAAVEQFVEAPTSIDVGSAVDEKQLAQTAAIELSAIDRGSDSESTRDVDTGASARQRPDLTTLANKTPFAVAASVSATQTESSAPSADAVGSTGPVSKIAPAKSEGVASPVDRFHASATSSKRGRSVEGTDEMPRVDPARFVGRVAKAFHTAQERGGTLQIRLSPPELGAMRLELSVKDGIMTASLETESVSAKRVLLEHLPALRERLAEQNVRIERFDVDVRREGGGQADPRATQDQHQPQQGDGGQRRRQSPQPPSAPPSRQPRPLSSARTNNNGINLVA